jgi:hypothetical protein
MPPSPYPPKPNPKQKKQAAQQALQRLSRVPQTTDTHKNSVQVTSMWRPRVAGDGNEPQYDTQPWHPGLRPSQANTPKARADRQRAIETGNNGSASRAQSIAYSKMASDDLNMWRNRNYRMKKSERGI